MYSLGIILFELLQPFHTEMEKCLSIQNLKSSQDFPPGLRDKFPKEVRKNYNHLVRNKLNNSSFNSVK